MTYFCYIETGRPGVPDMEPLEADSPTTAAVEALTVLRKYKNAVAAHVFDGDTPITSVRREEVRP